MPGELDLAQLQDPALRAVGRKVLDGQRLDAEDARLLYDTPDLLGLGALADFANRRRNGDRVFFSANQHINPTNVCILRNTCTFCSFARMPKEDGRVHPERWKRSSPRRSRRAACRRASSTSSAGCTPSSGSATTPT